MKDLLVIVGCTKESGMMRAYLQQLAQAGIETRVEHIPDFAAADSLGYQTKYVRALATKFSDWSRLVISDAFDVLFYGTKEEVISKIPVGKVIMAAERNCYPDPTMASGIPGDTPWKFSNGGLLAGTPQAFIRFADLIESHPFYHPKACNQTFFNQLLFHGHIPSDNLVVDSKTELFYCLYGEGEELQFDKGFPVNSVCKTRPNFIHANGKWPTSGILKRRADSLGEKPKELDLHPVKIPFTAMIEVKLCRECRDRLICEMN